MSSGPTWVTEQGHGKGEEEEETEEEEMMVVKKTKCGGPYM